MTTVNTLLSGGQGTTIPSGYIGEVKVATSTTAVTTGGVTVNSLSLEPGTWLINCSSYVGGDTAAREVYTSINTVLNTLPAFSTDGTVASGHYATSSGIGFVQVHSVYVKITTTSTYYQNSKSTSISGLSSTFNRLQAVRIA